MEYLFIYRLYFLIMLEVIVVIELYIDGASAGDPGRSGAGIVIKQNGHIEKYAIPLGMKNNHEAEFLALIKGLEKCLPYKHAIISARSDSAIVVQAIEKQYVGNKNFQKLLDQCIFLSNQFALFFIKWIPSNQNKIADQLAKQAIQKNKNGDEFFV